MPFTAFSNKAQSTPSLSVVGRLPAAERRRRPLPLKGRFAGRVIEPVRLAEMDAAVAAGCRIANVAALS
jgi:hypothetical protein